MKLEDGKVGKIVKCDLLKPGTTQRIGRTIFVRIMDLSESKVQVKAINGQNQRTEWVDPVYLHDLPIGKSSTDPPKPPRPKKIPRSQR